ncbi:trp operon leader peptide [Escherichia coli]|nr:trp operon leader peptide [Escherichia coli]
MKAIFLLKGWWRTS